MMNLEDYINKYAADTSIYYRNKKTNKVYDWRHSDHKVSIPKGYGATRDTLLPGWKGEREITDPNKIKSVMPGILKDEARSSKRKKKKNTEMAAIVGTGALAVGGMLLARKLKRLR
mgnify:CR=1 FL=1|tara:strand:+ start:354 stop:701 length:348 start_codon:yes stop_codon:yes gene_type:complete